MRIIKFATIRAGLAVFVRPPKVVRGGCRVRWVGATGAGTPMASGRLCICSRRRTPTTDTLGCPATDCVRTPYDLRAVGCNMSCACRTYGTHIRDTPDVRIMWVEG